jgi:apolipoprotein N-acyltransferase
MRGIPWRLLGLAVGTAVLLDLPFPLAGPLPAWRSVFAWFALVPLLVGVLRLPQAFPEERRRWRLRWAFLAGWLSGAIWFGANCYWVYNTMHVYGGMNAPLAALSLVLFSLYLGFWFGAFALVLAVVREATLGGKYAWLGLVAVPFLWTAMEFAIARIPGFPWDQLGYSQIDNGLLTRLAPWTGVYGITFVLASINALLVWVRLKPLSKPENWNRRAFIHPTEYGILLFLALEFLSNRVLVQSPKPAGEAMAMLVQPNLNVASDDVWVGPEWDRHIAQFAAFGAQKCTGYLAGLPETDAAQRNDVGCHNGQTPSLIVWPESPAPFRDVDPKFQSAMRMVAAADKAPLIVGAIGMDDDPVRQQYRIYNSASVFAQDGHSAGRYDKMHLVPFGEYVPHRELFFFVRQIAQSLTDMSVGMERKVFRINSSDAGNAGGAHRYGVFICYESVFGDEVRQFVRLGAEVLVNISDDGWYGDSSAPWQHLNMARMRAIENRRWILRDTNNGVTASIDPYGTVRQSIPRHEVGALAAQFGYSSEITFYTAHGDWLAELCAILSLVLIVWSGRNLLGLSGLKRSTSAS